jgi:hypothetical protein
MFVGDIGVQISIPAFVVNNGVTGPLTGYTVAITARDQLGNAKQWSGTIGTQPLKDAAGNTIAGAGYWCYYVTVSASDIPTSGDWRFEVVITQASPNTNVASTIVTIPVQARL